MERRVLIIAQNLPVPFDRRVWLVCRVPDPGISGYPDTVVCTKGSDDPGYQVVDLVELNEHRPHAPGGSKLRFIVEYAHSFLATARLVLRPGDRAGSRVIQACNPLDIFWPTTPGFRAIDDITFAFDHHDPCTKRYESRFPEGQRLPCEALCVLQRRPQRAVNHVISANGSYSDIAMTRDGNRADYVTIVRPGPDPGRLRRRPASPALRRGRGGQDRGRRVDLVQFMVASQAGSGMLTPIESLETMKRAIIAHRKAC